MTSKTFPYILLVKPSSLSTRNLWSPGSLQTIWRSFSPLRGNVLISGHNPLNKHTTNKPTGWWCSNSSAFHQLSLKTQWYGISMSYQGSWRIITFAVVPYFLVLIDRLLTLALLWCTLPFTTTSLVIPRIIYLLLGPEGYSKYGYHIPKPVLSELGDVLVFFLLLLSWRYEMLY